MVLMDVYEAEGVVRKGTTEETTRPPLGLSEKNNAVVRRPRTARDVPSRYKSANSNSHLVTTPVVPKRFPSPNVSRTTPTPSSFTNSKRSLSAERKRPSTPPSPPSPSTPAQDVSAHMQSAPRRVPGGWSEGLWPSSTMRSLCVSFQADTFSVPVSKKEKSVTRASYDHTLRPSANVADRKAETATLQRKATPERKKIPLRGRNASDQSENSKPTYNSHPRVVDQNRSSKIMGRKVYSSAINRGMDLTDEASKSSSLPLLRWGVSPTRRSSLPNGIPGSLQKAQSDLARLVSLDSKGVEHDLYAIDDVSSQSSGTDKLLSSSVSTSSDSSDCTLSTPHTIRSQSLPIPGCSRPASPCKARFLSSSPSRGISPSRTRPSFQYPSASSLGSRSSNTSSVLSFIADYRKGKKGANRLEDAHQLRLLYNTYQQWRFANARADAAFSIQKTTTETTLYNVWNTTSDLQHSVTIKRINLRQLREELRLQSVLDGQIAYLDDWDLLEGEHSSSLSEAMKALEACTLRLPITAGARADTHTVKKAICSTVDVMQAMVSSMDHLLPKVEGTNFLVSELADVTRQERAMLDEYVDLLASTATMQVEENSLRAHLIQLKQIAGHQISTTESPA